MPISEKSTNTFGQTGPLISFWQPKELTVGLAGSKLHPLSYPHAVINAHPITCTPYAKFKPDWSINVFLVHTLCPIGVAMTRLHPLTHTRLIILTHVLGNLIPN